MTFGKVGTGLATHGPNRLSVAPHGRFEIGKDVLLGLNVMIRVGGEGAELILEDGVQIQDNTCILCNGKLRIGKDSIIVNGTII